MERLTERNEGDTDYFYPACFKKCGGMGSAPKCDSCWVHMQICEKLGRYEDIGLTPEQILEIDGMYRELAEKLAERENKQWIPCSERLPEENTNIIACFAHGLVTELRFRGGLFHGIYDYTTKIITAWMPLPEPCKVAIENAHTEKPQTNADRIRSMTDDELAEMLSTVSQHCVVYLSDKINCRHSSCDTGCKNNIKKWLQEDSEE